MFSALGDSESLIDVNAVVLRIESLIMEAKVFRQRNSDFWCHAGRYKALYIMQAVGSWPAIAALCHMRIQLGGQPDEAASRHMYPHGFV